MNNINFDYHHDAIGNKIVIGEKYGWSKNNTLEKGGSCVFIGIAEEYTDKGVTFEVINKRTEYFFNSSIDKKRIQIKGMMVFPIFE